MPQPSRWSPPHTPFTLQHVAPLGVTAEMLDWALSRGRITRLTHGVFVATDAVPDDRAQRHVQVALALQLRNPLAIASHQTAALAWGLELEDPRAAAESAAQFIVPRRDGVRSRNEPGMRIRSRALPIHHRTTHPSGLLLTTRPRTAVDVAAECTLPDALVTLDAAARHELLGSVGERGLRRAYSDEAQLAAARQPLLEAAEFAATRLTRHRMAELLSWPDPRRESPLESLSYGHFVMAGLPLPLMQVRVATPLGDVFPDFLWPEARVIGEVDGAVKYRLAEDLVMEKRRQEALEQLGFLVVRWMADELRLRPASVVSRVAAALSTRT